jgi:hypothetical protein
MVLADQIVKFFDDKLLAQANLPYDLRLQRTSEVKIA